ncbi:hypothetical protein MSI_17980 [Treponema sp. JC4]|nr:hypothetical protein [Treponema sp. JC4]EID84749.1 hypothetical protein MSI_17980 [Treponema sp. JC4]
MEGIYGKNEYGICASGTIEEVTDQSVKEDLWQTGWLLYYHKEYS